jgi:hypothetical protein
MSPFARHGHGLESRDTGLLSLCITSQVRVYSHQLSVTYGCNTLYSSFASNASYLHTCHVYFLPLLPSSPQHHLLSPYPLLTPFPLPSPWQNPGTRRNSRAKPLRDPFTAPLPTAISTPPTGAIARTSPPATTSAKTLFNDNSSTWLLRRPRATEDPVKYAKKGAAGISASGGCGAVGIRVGIRRDRMWELRSMAMFVSMEKGRDGRVRVLR